MWTGSSKRSIRWWLRLLSSLTVLALITAGLPGCGFGESGPPEKAQVSRVIDGDTLELAAGQRLRVLGIDAPEMEKDGHPAEFLAHRSKAALSDLTQGQVLRLEYDRLRYDHYGRLLAYLFLADGTCINAEMLRLGLAHVYFHNPNLSHREELLAAQREAMEAKRGLWQRPLNQDEEYYLGNINSLRFHRPGCNLAVKMAPANRVRQDTLKEAYLQGYSPCRSCKP